MQIRYFPDYQAMSLAAGESLRSDIQQKPDLLLCAATGHSPLAAYQYLASAAKADAQQFSRLRLLKLDEWGGIPLEHPDSCESYLQEQLIAPLRINADRYFGFESQPIDPEQTCAEVRAVIQQQGPVDICVLGLGPNGHIGMNEPAEVLQPNFHIAELSEQSLQHSMVLNMDPKPGYGLTLGIADIMLSRKVMLLITGSRKKWALEELLSKRITTLLPASLLWLHPNVECLVDQGVLGEW